MKRKRAGAAAWPSKRADMGEAAFAGGAASRKRARDAHDDDDVEKSVKRLAIASREPSPQGRADAAAVVPALEPGLEETWGAYAATNAELRLCHYLRIGRRAGG